MGAALHELDDGLGGHAAGLGGEVDALTGALGDVTGGVADEGDAALDTAGTVVLGDGVGLDLDDLATGNLLAGTVADGLLVLLDGGTVDDGAGADTDVVVLGEDPAVEVGGDVVTDVHLGHLLVELHLVVGDLDALLEGDGEVVKAGVHALGDAGVGTVGTDDDVDVHGLGLAGGGALGELEVVDRVGLLGGLVVGGDVDGGDEAVDGLGSVLDGAVAEVLVHDLTAAHADVLVGLEGVTDVDLDAGGGDEVHLADLAVDDSLGDVELADHAKGDGTAAGLGVVHLALEHDGVDVLLLGEDLGGAGTGGSATNDGNLVL